MIYGANCNWYQILYRVSITCFGSTVFEEKSFQETLEVCVRKRFHTLSLFEAELLDKIADNFHRSVPVNFIYLFQF